MFEVEPELEYSERKQELAAFCLKGNKLQYYSVLPYRHLCTQVGSSLFSLCATWQRELLLLREVYLAVGHTAMLTMFSAISHLATGIQSPIDTSDYHKRETEESSVKCKLNFGRVYEGGVFLLSVLY